MTPDASVAIVGAGPAGLAAATQAAALGLPVALIDENLMAGGQYYRQAPPGFVPRPGGDAGLRRGEASALLDVVGAAGVRFFPRTAVWGIFDDRVLALDGPEAPRFVQAGAIVLAPGACERAFPFPGWTLPGVFTAGGLQILAKSQGLLPGRRVLLAGNGPFLLVVAVQLLEAGAEVVAVVEASAGATRWTSLRALFGHWDVVREGLGHLRRLSRARVPILTGHAIVAAEGEDDVREAVVAPIGPDGSPDASARRRFAVDIVGVGYGFVPSTELLRQAGGEVRHAPDLGGWIPVRSDWLESTVPGIFVAGDGGGVAGARAAVVQGRLAAVGAARALAALPDRRATETAASLRREMEGLEGLGAALREIYRTGLRPTACLTPDTLLCRCEAVAVRHIDEAIREGARTLHEIKIYTRAGMGPCQGRVCAPVAAALLAERLGVPPDAVRPPSVRPPVKPVRLGVLAASAAEQAG